MDMLSKLATPLQNESAQLVQKVLKMCLIVSSTCFWWILYKNLNIVKTIIFSIITLINYFYYRNMSSKRKSPPTKLQEGSSTEAPPIQTNLGSGSDGGGLTDLDETSSNNLSDICEEDTNTMVNTSSAFYNKLSESSSPSGCGSEIDDGLDEDHIPSKTAKISANDGTHSIMTSVSPCISALSLHNEEMERRRNSSECSSPSSDIKSNFHYNNNNNSLMNNNSSLHPLKRSMDDVLKRLTSKISNSSVREERRPTPSSTPNSHNS